MTGGDEAPGFAELMAERIAQRNVIRAAYESDTEVALAALARLDELNAASPAPEADWLANTDLWAARVLMRADRAAEAVSRLERAAAGGGQARYPALSMRAWMLVGAGRYAEAEQQARDLLAESKVYAEDMHLVIAKSRHGRGMVDEAWAYLREHGIEREDLSRFD